MSDYRDLARHPVTGNIEQADWLDNYYGRHRYAVRFDDGTIVPAEKAKLPAVPSADGEGAR